MRTGFWFVGVRGFEPPASSSRTTRANRAALHPEKNKSNQKKNFPNDASRQQ
jgi:hypothetical protein